MLWTVRHRWAAGARFAFNCYRHSAILIVRNPGGIPFILNSNEGVTQGDPLSMVLYGLALLPLSEYLRKEVPDVLQPWYADDCMLVGKASHIDKALGLIKERGEPRGYLAEPNKSLVACNPDAREAAKQQLKAWKLTYLDGFRYVGGFIGTKEARAAWLSKKAEDWVHGVVTLGKIAKRFPQTAYAGLTKSLQNEWQYTQRVVEGCAEVFQPVEDAIRDSFLPHLLDEPAASCPDRVLTALPVKQAGMGIPNPVETAHANYAASKSVTRTLSESLSKTEHMDVRAYRDDAKAARKEGAKRRHKLNEAVLKGLSDTAPNLAVKRRLERAKETGGWLTVMPNALNGTELSADEFRDNSRLRLGLQPKGLPTRCDGRDCG